MDIQAQQLRTRYAAFDNGPYGIDKYADSLALLFQENTKLNPMLSRRYGIKLGQFDNDYYRRRAMLPYKVYPGAQRVDLSDYHAMGAPRADYFATLANRRSERNYDPYAISLREIHTLCHYSYGIGRHEATGAEDGQQMAFRYLPSGGGLYPLEMYVLILNGDPAPGLYHYRPDLNALEQLKRGDHRETARTMLAAEPYIDLVNASAVILITSMIERVIIKYGDRGYRWVLMEVGALAQNAALAATATGLGTCLAGSFLDEQVNEFLAIDGVSETIQKAIIVGKPAVGCPLENDQQSGN
jgi:SagB-type dehydrogenase family enzyme